MNKTIISKAFEILDGLERCKCGRMVNMNVIRKYGKCKECILKESLHKVLHKGR